MHMCGPWCSDTFLKTLWHLAFATRNITKPIWGSQDFPHPKPVDSGFGSWSRPSNAIPPGMGTDLNFDEVETLRVMSQDLMAEGGRL